MGDPNPVRRKKLLFRAMNRGTREVGLLLGSFAEAHLAGFDVAQLDRFEALLEIQDGILYDWIARREIPPVEDETDVLRLLLNFPFHESLR